eukprot:scaffold93291_cov29-Tisochrysis_lutea.AAC.2
MTPPTRATWRIDAWCSARSPPAPHAAGIGRTRILGRRDCGWRGQPTSGPADAAVERDRARCAVSFYSVHPPSRVACTP